MKKRNLWSMMLYLLVGAVACNSGEIAGTTDAVAVSDLDVTQDAGSLDILPGEAAGTDILPDASADSPVDVPLDSDQSWTDDGGDFSDGGNSDGGGQQGEDGGTTTDGGLIDKASACLQCQTEHCQEEKDACATVDSDAGTFTGPCAEVATCLLGCSDEVCWALCVAKSGPQCAICAKKLRDCEQAACGAVCKIELQDDADAGSNSDAGVAEDPCEALAACCPNLPPLAKIACETTVSAGNPQVCGASLAAAGDLCE